MDEIFTIEEEFDIPNGAFKNAVKPLQYRISDNGCWVVVNRKHIAPTGYFRINRLGKTLSVHRYIYERFVGKIPDKHLIRHKCDNAFCINPNHLETGTPKDNSMDMSKRDRCLFGERHQFAKLKEGDVINILEAIKNGESKWDLSKKYNVHERTIRKIRSGQNWRRTFNSISQ